MRTSAACLADAVALEYNVGRRRRFMSINTAVEQLLEIEADCGGGAYGPDTMCVGLARVGAEGQTVVAGPMKQLFDVDFGPPLHSLVIAGDLHPIETEMLEFLKRTP